MGVLVGSTCWERVSDGGLVLGKILSVYHVGEFEISCDSNYQARASRATKCLASP